MRNRTIIRQEAVITIEHVGAWLSHLAFIGNSLPRRCGIANVTTHLQQEVAAWRPELDTSILAMTDHGHIYDYPPVVCCEIGDDQLRDYRAAADFLNDKRVEAVSARPVVTSWLFCRG
jgi:hypothetical protein